MPLVTLDTVSGFVKDHGAINIVTEMIDVFLLKYYCKLKYISD